ncbi:MAG: YgeY family selenium metabolism-linked hydrolase [Anaerolineales bacterium]|nr:YgeY family selenium metabolism-linked hydrolase [Anaerolineales bacterium]MCS7247677.1 YgeY family selenium metabolism-linked hydrolase [Anaerolineales bacterium]MDW8161487.1 YgeY family selenium metabolism-linked hydrolase [Anaerolineales bacterium]MDW8447049.1 YgeY family selenium metabolism-linked hydrolase [Anaerolineales bacterium]
MVDWSKSFPPEVESELVEFAQHLIRIRSFSGQEGEIVRFIERKMLALGYDEVFIDAMGNVVGKIGDGGQAIWFDSHIDTVQVNDAAEWEVPPFGGEIREGRLYGRGAADMKCGAAASICAAALAKRLGWIRDKTVYVSCTVLEEDCDGENLKHLFNELRLRPDYVVICEPSNNQIALGHKGKAQISIKTYGVSAHSASPEKGVNAVYEMAEVIRRVEQTHLELMKKGEPRATLALCGISSVSVSPNAIPAECEVYLDRRIVPGESEADLQEELAQIIRGKRATWEIQTLRRKSWTGMEVEYRPFHLAWQIGLDHELTQACIAAYRETFGTEPSQYGFWDFSTNAVTPVRLGIPTIGFGPGDPKLAHMRNEFCEVRQLLEACVFYTRLLKNPIGPGREPVLRKDSDRGDRGRALG